MFSSSWARFSIEQALPHRLEGCCSSWDTRHTCTSLMTTMHSQLRVKQPFVFLRQHAQEWGQMWSLCLNIEAKVFASTTCKSNPQTAMTSLWPKSLECWSSTLLSTVSSHGISFRYWIKLDFACLIILFPCAFFDSVFFLNLSFNLALFILFFFPYNRYTDAVFSGKWGLSKGYLFFLDRSYWLGPKIIDSTPLHVVVGSADSTCFAIYEHVFFRKIFAKC